MQRALIASGYIVYTWDLVSDVIDKLWRVAVHTQAPPAEWVVVALIMAVKLQIRLSAGPGCSPWGVLTAF